MRATLRLSNLIDRDRRAVEVSAMQSARTVASRIRSRVLEAVRQGADPHSAVVTVDMEDGRRLGDVLADAMMVSHLRGWKRTALIYELRSLSRGAQMALSRDTAKLRRDLGLTRDITDALKSVYTRSGDAAASRLLNRVAETVRLATAEASSSAEAAKLAREAFDSAGLNPGRGFALQTEFTTAVQVGYNAGRESQLRTVWDEIWGFEYVAEIDDRTTQLCEDLDGTVRPKDDPFWDRYSPPNHYNCRSNKVELTNRQRSTEVPDDIDEPGDGFDFNPADRFNAARVLG